MNWLSPWIVLRLMASAVLCLVLLRAAPVSIRVLRRWDAHRANEGQLLLEKQVQLSTTLLRVAGVSSVVALLFFVLAADKLSHGIRGAMCAYGVFAAENGGFRALYASLITAFLTAVVAHFASFEARTKVTALARPLAWFTLLLVPIALIDCVLSARFLLNLDLSVVASCCSVDLDGAGSTATPFTSGPRTLIAVAAPLVMVAASLAGLLAARRPRRAPVVFAGALGLFALPLALASVVLYVAPYAFELPTHLCPFCLLHADVYGIGYPLFLACFAAAVWATGAALAALYSTRPGASEAFAEFARVALRREAFAWGCALLVGAIPVVHYLAVSGGRSIFP